MTEMMQPEPTSQNFLTHRWHQTGLRTRLTIGAVLVSIVAVGMLFLFVRSRITQTTDFILDQFGTLSLTQAENQLSSLVTEESLSFDRFFATVTEDLFISSDYVTSMFTQQDVFGQGDYWNANEEIVQLGEGQWGNSLDDPGSFLAPASFELTPETAVIANTGIMVDFVLPQVLKTNPNLLAVYYIDHSGATFYYPNIDLANIVGDFDPRERPYYQTFITNSTQSQPFFWSEPYADAALNGLVSTNSVPVFSPEGEFSGVLAADLLIKTITDRVSEFRIGETGYAFLIDKNGQYIAVPEIAYADLGITTADASSEDFLTETTVDAPDALQPIFAEMMAEGEGLKTFVSNDSEKFIAYAPVEASGYSLGIVVPVAEMQQAFLSTRQQATQANEESRQIISLIFIAILFVSAIIGYGMSFFLTRPIEALTKVAEQVAAGNLEARADNRMGGEMGILARTFNETTQRIQELVTGLELLVADRTRALETSNEVGRSLSQILDVNELTSEVVRRVRDAFDYYHVHIYLFDDNQQNLILAGGTGQAGKIMLAQRHQIPKEKGLVGRAATTKAPVFIEDVIKVEDWLPNPLLPDTKSELAVPIAIGDKVLGVLDVQHNQLGVLTEGSMGFLQSIASQIAIALRNARLYEQAQRKANQEAIVNQIGQQIQQAINVEGVLQTAARELAQALGSPRVSIEIGQGMMAGNGRAPQKS
jgi:putative methionine-R-sulfoxide reductase with GAF domain